MAFMVNLLVSVDDSEAGAVVGRINGKVLIHLTVPPFVAGCGVVVLNEHHIIASVVTMNDQLSREAPTIEF